MPPTPRQGVFGAAQPCHHAGGRAWIEHRGARSDPAYGGDQIGAVDLLEHISRRARHDGVEQCLVVIERRQHQAGELGHQGAQLPAHLDTGVVTAAVVAEAYVQHGDLGSAGRYAGQRLAGVGRLADDLDVVLGLQQIAYAAPDDLVVVEDEDAYGGRGRRRGRTQRGRARWGVHGIAHIVLDRFGERAGFSMCPCAGPFPPGSHSMVNGIRTGPKGPVAGGRSAGGARCHTDAAKIVRAPRTSPFPATPLSCTEEQPAHEHPERGLPRAARTA